MRFSLLTLAIASLFAAAAPAQIARLKDIRAGRLGSVQWPSGSQTAMVSNGEVAIFVADDGAALGRTVWRTNGSPAGTFHLKTGLKNPRWLTSAGRLMFFSASDSANGEELWVTDGTSAGTRIPKKLMNGLLNSTQAIVATHNGIVYFFAYGMVSNRRTLGLWRSDGTANGTFLLKTGTLGFSLRFLATRWRSAPLGKDLYFLNQETGVGELWKTDGTVAGTKQVFRDRTKWIAPIITWKGRLWCDVVASAKHELWTSDGTAAGTKQFVKGWAVQPTPAASGDVMYFSFAPTGTGQQNELWKTDGTAAGTTRVTNKISITSSPGVPLGGRKIFFSGRGKPWVSDGTAAGTVQLSSTFNIFITPDFKYKMARVGDGSVAIFQSSGSLGAELAITDGTPQGTRQIDFYKGGRSGMPVWGWARTRENFALFLDDGKAGLEPHAIALTWFGAAFNEPYGRGCSGTNGVPKLRGVGGAPTLGNSKFALELTDARPNGIAVLCLSAKPANIPLGPCTLLIDLTGAMLEGRPIDAAGKLRVPLAVPNSTALIGLNVYWQDIVIDPKGALANQFAFSNGLRTLIGR